MAVGFEKPQGEEKNDAQKSASRIGDFQQSIDRHSAKDKYPPERTGMNANAIA